MSVTDNLDAIAAAIDLSTDEETTESDIEEGSDPGIEEATDSAMTVAEWIGTRPVTGAVALVVGGLLITWPSLQFLLQASMVESGARIVLGIPVGVLSIAGGMFVLTNPSYSSKIGIAALFISTVSFLVAFGGFLIGMIITGIGGMLCFAWEPDEE